MNELTPKISEVIEELKRLQVEFGDLPVYGFDSDYNLRGAWPELSVNDKKEHIILI